MVRDGRGEELRALLIERLGVDPNVADRRGAQAP
jgi:hypothetical protein